MAKAKTRTAPGDRGGALPPDGTLLTARGVRTRTALLAGARRAFETKRYANTTIADITREAGCAQGSFYTYFNSKEELLEQLAEDFERENATLVSELELTITEPYPFVRELCAIHWRTCRKYSVELAAIFQASMQDEQFRHHWQEIRANAHRKIAGIIVAAERAGLVSAPTPHTETLASAIGAMMQYFCYLWLVDGGEPGLSMPGDEAAIDTMARIFYRSVFADHEPGGPQTGP